MKDNGKLLSALLVGAAAGAVLGLLFAPEKGSDTRKKIADDAEDLFGKLQKKINEAKEAITDIKGKSSEKADEFKHKAFEKADDLKGAVENELYNGAKNKGRSAT